MRNIYILYFRQKLCHCQPYAVIFTFSSTPIFIRNWSMHPQLFRFARASSNVSDLNCRNKALTVILLRHGYRYINFVRRFQSFIADTVGGWNKYIVSLKNLLQQGISEPEFYGDLVSRIRKIVRTSIFSEQFRKHINRYKNRI